MKRDRLRYIAVFTLLGMGLACNDAHARNWWYLEADATRTTIDVSQTQFNPILPRYKMGVFITQDILLEAQYTGSGDDTASNTTIGVENISAAYLRLDSGIRSNMRIYVLLGGAKTKLNVNGAGGATAGTDTYQDFSWGVGMEDRTWSQHTLLTLEYTRYYDNNDVTISGVSLGFKFEY